MARPDPLDPEGFVYGVYGESESVTLSVSTGPGAAPPGSTVVGVNLDDDGAPVRVGVTESGSFTLAIEHDVEDVLRFWVVAGTARSIPVDVVESVTERQFVVHEPPSCLSIPIEVAVPAGATALTITNRCAANIPVNGLTARLEQAGLTVSGPPPLIPAGDTVELELVVDDGATVDEILLFDVEVSGQAERYATSVYTE